MLLDPLGSTTVIADDLTPSLLAAQGFYAGNGHTLLMPVIPQEFSGPHYPTQ
jgi:hypothetical protein